MTRRLFFALWPSAELADEIVPRAARLGLGGRLVSRERLHLTLAFEGEADQATVDGLLSRAAAVDIASFTLVVDRIDCFGNGRTVWFGPSHTPAPLAGLVAALTDAGADLDRPAFVPHITVMRDGPPIAPEPLFPPLIWHVGRFCLVESGAEGVPGAYRTLGEWPLGAGRPATTME